MSAQHRSPFNKDDIIAEPLESGSRLKARRAATYYKYIIFHNFIYQFTLPIPPQGLTFATKWLKRYALEYS